ncbi:MAG: UDP-N-acetylmuramoyl-L-alanyl-D-glutamate--2,6-diaminopimelate ligase [Bacteroidota bacterium]|jgi:UDP-N-acetylmuramoyl-L-alanyl-D-glutamate--2,6-diaminopimelate ligase
MRVLQDILYKISIQTVVGNTDIPVSSVEIDSRLVKQSSCFIAIKGASSDGHLYISNAIASGASAVVCEEIPVNIEPHVTYIQTNDAAKAAGIMCHAFHDHPTNKLKLVGITGTNGKTTVATVLFNLCREMGMSVGLISTVNNRINDQTIPSTHTTPDVVQLNQLLHQMSDAGCVYVFMEVSSHAIHQQRISDLHFTGAVFTNITHDHLDYHKTFDEYRRVKKLFFDQLSASSFSIINEDDKNGSYMLQNTAAKKFTYSLKHTADFKGKIIDNSIMGLHMLINDQEVMFRLIGEFNAYNLLAVYGTAISLGFDKQEVLRVMSNLHGAEGRFDWTVSPKEGVIGIVDYAHTPDALLNVLATIKKLQKGYEQVITVVGCGGDRDRSKRKVMGATAAMYSNKAILTSDNPRTENPSQILQEMKEDMAFDLLKKVVTVEDRREAIRMSVMLAKKDDIILVAGKGHEKYQEIKGVKTPFDDKAVLLEAFKELDK